MSDELLISGKNYISSKQAAKITGYAQDYIGQLARAGNIEAQRVGGLWYVFLDSLTAYKTRTDDFKPQPPTAMPAQDPESVVSFDGKDYISASRAAKVTGYNQDYIGQLARSGKILSRQIGNRWYVDRAGLIEHKTEKDGLLAAVQRDAVGLPPVRAGGAQAGFPRPASSFAAPQARHIEEGRETAEITTTAYNLSSEPREAPVALPKTEYVHAGPVLTYISEHKDLMPVMRSDTADHDIAAPQRIPITIKATRSDSATESEDQPRRKRFPAAIAIKGVSALTIVVVLSYGMVSMKNSAHYAQVQSSMSQLLEGGENAAGAAGAIAHIGDILENVVSRELVYIRSGSN